MAHHPKESFFGAVFEDGSLVIWNPNLYEIQHETNPDRFGNFTCLAFYPGVEKKLILAGTLTGEIHCLGKMQIGFVTFLELIS